MNEPLRGCRSSERLREGFGNWKSAQPFNTGSTFVSGVNIPGGMFVLTNSTSGSEDFIYEAAQDRWRPASPATSMQPASHLHAAIARMADLVYVMVEAQFTWPFINLIALNARKEA